MPLTVLKYTSCLFILISRGRLHHVESQSPSIEDTLSLPTASHFTLTPRLPIGHIVADRHQVSKGCFVSECPLCKTCGSQNVEEFVFKFCYEKTLTITYVQLTHRTKARTRCVLSIIPSKQWRSSNLSVLPSN
jgi:hypothetical protein